MHSGKSSSHGPTPENLAIQSLRELIPDVIASNPKFDSNFYLWLWLKAQKLNPGKAEIMIRKSLKWRDEQDIESDWGELNFLEFKDEFGAAYGSDHLGNFVAYSKIGSMDFRRGLSKYGKKLWVKNWLKYFAVLEDEIFTHHSQSDLKDENGILYQSFRDIIIVDVKGFSPFLLTSLDVLRSAVEILSAVGSYCPASFGLVIFINMNKIFKGVFHAIKPLLMLPYLKLEVYGTDEREWTNRLLQLFDEDLLQEFLCTT